MSQHENKTVCAGRRGQDERSGSMKVNKVYAEEIAKWDGDKATKARWLKGAIDSGLDGKSLAEVVGEATGSD